MKGLEELLGAKVGKPEAETGTDAEDAAEGDTEGKTLTSAIYDALVSRDRDAFHEALEAYMVHCIGEPSHEDESPKSEPGNEKPGGLAIILGKH